MHVASVWLLLAKYFIILMLCYNFLFVSESNRFLLIQNLKTCLPVHVHASHLCPAIPCMQTGSPDLLALARERIAVIDGGAYGTRLGEGGPLGGGGRQGAYTSDTFLKKKLLAWVVFRTALLWLMTGEQSKCCSYVCAITSHLTDLHFDCMSVMAVTFL